MVKLITLIPLIFIAFLTPNKVFGASAKQKRLYRYLKAPYTDLRFKVSTWQETIDIESDGQASILETRFDGIGVGYSRFKPLNKIKWVRVYGADIDIGVAKGSAQPPAVDQIKNQFWIKPTAFYGYVYRTGLRSQVSIKAPVSYRALIWDLEDNLEVNDDAFSVGLSGSFGVKFNAKTSLNFTVEHQFMWNASIWSIQYTKEFR